MSFTTNKRTSVVSGKWFPILTARSLYSNHFTHYIGTSAFMTEERVGLYEFVAMGTPTKAKFIFRAPTLSFVTNIYYLPFQANVWYSLVALVVISCIVIYYTYRISHMRSPQTEEILRPSDIFLFGVSSICQMGTHREPKYASGKISTVVVLCIRHQ